MRNMVCKMVDVIESLCHFLRILFMFGYQNLLHKHFILSLGCINFLSLVTIGLSAFAAFSNSDMYKLEIGDVKLCCYILWILKLIHSIHSSKTHFKD